MAYIKVEADFLDPSRLASNKTFDFLEIVDNHPHHHGPSWPQTNFQIQTATVRNLKSFTQNDYWSNMNAEVQTSANLPMYLKMESDNGIYDNAEGPTVDNGIFDGSTSSRSNSPLMSITEGQLNGDGTDGKQMKTDSKICGVCGDKALGNNFNAITCESCKAFFRRNALKPKEFVCPFSNSCKVDPVTRRFCQKCRLKKCFDIGMKKEWIMTDEEKKIKKQKIEQNRLKRQSSDVPFSSSEPPLAKAACMVEPLPSVDHNVISQNSPPDPTLPHKTPSMPHNHDQIVQIQPKDSSYSFSQSPSHSVNNANSSNNGLFCMNNNNNLPTTNFESVSGSNSATTTILSERSALSPVSEQFHPGGGREKLSQNQLYMHQQMTTTTASDDTCQSVQVNGGWCADRAASNMSPEGSGIFIQKNSNTGTDFETVPAYQTQMPLLSSLMRPGVAESPPDAQPVTISNGNSSNKTSDLSPSSPFVLNGHAPSENHSVSAAIVETCVDEDSCDFSDVVMHKTKLRRGSCVNHRVKRCTNNYEPLPLPLNTMDSIIGVAINAEFNACGVLSAEQTPSSRHLNKAEQNKLNELLMASQALNTPVDAEGHDVKVSDPSLINVINLTDIAIRRLIKMSKKISGFKNMCQEDQVALLKGSCTEMMILRSVVSYDPDRDSWNIPHSKLGYNIKLGVLKEARGNLYEEHQRFVKSFKSEWRCDENIMIILCAITLFTSERPNVIHKDVVKLEQDSYYYLLKRFLESKFNGCEARSNFLLLIKKIAELHELNSNHLRVFLEVNPREVEPLLIEIFDLK